MSFSLFFSFLVRAGLGGDVGPGGPTGLCVVWKGRMSFGFGRGAVQTDGLFGRSFCWVIFFVCFDLVGIAATVAASTALLFLFFFLLLSCFDSIFLLFCWVLYPGYTTSFFLCLVVFGFALYMFWRTPAGWTDLQEFQPKCLVVAPFFRFLSGYLPNSLLGGLGRELGQLADMPSSTSKSFVLFPLYEIF